MARLDLRRTRINPHMRELAREVRLHVEQFVQPLFVVEDLEQREAIPGLPDTWRETTDSLAEQIAADLEAGISKFLLFGVPAEKSTGNHAANFADPFTEQQIRALKERFGDAIWLAVDVCLCSSTEHGHCGLMNDAGDYVDNEQSVDALVQRALAYAEAGADCVAPSDMMDGRVGEIRAGLDQLGLEQTAIMSYSAKFHSAFYGPFRVAAESAPSQASRLTDRATYQIDPTRSDDALLSSQRDHAEGADILMVKPALPYLDVLARLSAELPGPWAAYQTSGEAAGIELLAAEGLTDRKRAHVEAWTAIARAGARIIISYYARKAAAWLA